MCFKLLITYPLPLVSPLVSRSCTCNCMDACTLLPRSQSFYRLLSSQEKDGACCQWGRPAVRTATEYKIVVTGFIGVHSMHLQHVSNLLLAFLCEQ